MKAKCMPAFLLPTSDYHKYFSDDVCDGLELIEAEYGLKGFAIVIKLWQKIYGSNEGYYCKWNDKACSLFAKNIGAGKGLVLEIVNRMIKEGIFDADLFQRFGILTSEWIQQSWVDYMKRRPTAKIESSYLLIKCAQNSENANKNEENACKNQKNADKSTLTEQNLTEQNLTELNLTEDCGRLLTAEQYNELADLSSVGSLCTYMNKIIDWQNKNGKKCRDPYSTIRKWIEQDSSRQQKEEHKPSYDMDEFMQYALKLGMESTDNTEDGKK